MKKSWLGKAVVWSTSPMGTAVHALGLTQIIAWGTTIYALGVLSKPMMATTGWSSTVVFSGLTIGLLVSGLISTWFGRFIDKVGAKAVMTVGAVLNACGLVLLAYVYNPYAYFAVWVLLGVSMRMTLYDAAFAALVQVTPQRGRRAISYLTLYGGFASTVFWPVGHILNGAVGWRETCLIFAALNLLACAPLSWWGLARREDAAAAAVEASAGEAGGTRQEKPLEGAAKVIAIVLFSITTSAYAFIFGAASVHLVAIIETTGIATAVAVTIASLKGVAQVGGRLWEIVFARNMAPINLARVPVGLMPISFVILLSVEVGILPALIFTLCFGAANGLITIVRGALPLALFGPQDYGMILGILATPYLLINALAPAAFAVIINWGGYKAGQWLLFGASLVSLLAMEIMTIWYRRLNTKNSAVST